MDGLDGHLNVRSASAVLASGGAVALLASRGSAVGNVVGIRVVECALGEGHGNADLAQVVVEAVLEVVVVVAGVDAADQDGRVVALGSGAGVGVGQVE